MGCAGSTASGEALRDAQSELEQEREARSALTRKRDTLEQRIAQLERELTISEESKARLTNPQALAKALSASKSKGGDTASEVQRLRTMICDLEEVEAAAKVALDKLIVPLPATSRAGYLRALPELIGPPPQDRKWQHEWVALRVECHKINGDEEWANEGKVRQKDNVENATRRNQHLTDDLVRRGWPEASARAYSVLSTVTNSIARALRDETACYAAATYALCDAIFEAKERAASTKPPKLYKNLDGRHSLTSKEPLWAKLQIPDGTGFRGLTSSALVTASCKDSSFSEDGFAVAVTQQSRQTNVLQVIAISLDLHAISPCACI